MFLILAGVALVILIYYYVVKPYKYWKERGVTQGQPLWVLGDTWKMMFRLESSMDMVKDVYNRFPGTRYTGLYQFFLPTLMIKDADLLKQITIKDFDHFVDRRSFLPDDVDPLWGKNLVALQGQKWRDMRTLLSPSFTGSKLKTMFVLIKEYAENVAEHFLKKDQNICKVEARDLFTRITNDIIATTSFGVKVDSLAQPDNSFYLMGKDMGDLTKFKTAIIFFSSLIHKKINKILNLKLFSKETRTYFTDVINESVKIREEKEIKRPDMINLMVQARKNGRKHENGINNGIASGEESVKRILPTDITNDDIAAQAMIFFLGGFDTVSSLMSFTSYELALNQDIQARLRQEIYNTLEECGGNVTYDAISNMKYMDMVISESLRKWPNFILVDRVCTKDYIIEPETPDEKPIYLKKGSPLLLPIYGIHHNPKYHPDPERFDPERFSDENKGKMHPYSFFSFGLGPRSCIGSRFATIETKTVFFYILSNFEIIPVKETDIPIKVSKKSFNLQAEQLWLGLKRINKQKI